MKGAKFIIAIALVVACFESGGFGLVASRGELLAHLSELNGSPVTSILSDKIMGAISPGHIAGAGFLSLVIGDGINALAPAATSTVAPTKASVPTVSATVTQRATVEPTRKASPTVTPTKGTVATVSATATQRATVEPTRKASPTATPTKATVPTVSATATQRGTAEPTRKASPTVTPVNIATATATATWITLFTPTPTPTDTATATDIATPTPTDTATATDTATPTPTDTPTPTATPQPPPAVLSSSPGFSVSASCGTWSGTSLYYLFDNSVIGGQYWGNGVNVLPCDIVVDMGKVYTLSSYGFDRLLEVNVWDSSRSISAHDVFTSLDNAAWTLQVSATAPPLAPGAWLNNFPSPVAARYVILRIYSNHSSDGQKWVDFHELKFR